MSKPELRPAERTAYCRGCDKKIQRGEPMVSFYSFRNTGMSIHLCLNCAEDIGELVKEHKESNDITK